MISFLKEDLIKQWLDKNLSDRKFSFLPLNGGLLNQNVLVTQNQQKMVLKVYRPEMTLSKVNAMHQVMEFAAEHNIPVPLPISINQQCQLVVALYPFLQGTHPPKFKNTPSKIFSMGEMLGKLQTVLAQFPSSSIKPTSEKIASWNPELFWNEIQTIKTSLQTQSVQIRNEVTAILSIYEKIIGESNWPKNEFLKLPIHFCHNDYHTENILMVGNKITAILDWEKAEWTWRIFELMRSIIFNCRKNERELDWNLIKKYTEGYRRYVKLTELEKQLVFECGYVKTLFDLWALKQYLAGRKEMRGNMQRRVALLKTLTEHRAEFAERLASYL